MEMKKFGLNETKLFHFHRIFKNGGRKGGLIESPEPSLDRHCRSGTVRLSLNMQVTMLSVEH